MNFSRTVLAAALALAALPAAAQTYSQTVFFGDSLTDAGTFRPALIQVAGPNGALIGRFTTNPGQVWAEYLASFYGTDSMPANQGGTDYAVGGARVDQTGSATLAPGVTVPVPSMTAQVNAYLTANGGRADPNALYTVWGGNNDVFAAIATAQAGGNPTPVIGSAVQAQIGLVGALEAAGARYVLVPTIPDIGLTPGFRAQGQAAQGAGTQLATAYNAALFSGLSGAGLRVIPLDTFHLFQEVVANPASFGLSNVTGTACQPQITAQSLTCNPGTYVTPGAADTYAFADGVHPTSAAHRILGDFAISMLEAPRQVALLTNVAAGTGRARADRVATRAIGAQQAEGSQWWADARGDFQRYDSGDLYDGSAVAVTGGMDWNMGSVLVGGFAGFEQGKTHVGSRTTFDQDDATLGLHAAWRSGGAWIDGQLSYTWSSIDMDRNVQLGNGSRMHHASTDGTNLTAGVQGGWEFGDGSLRHGPVLSVLSQRIEIDGFAEDQSTLSTSLAYPEQSFDSLIGSIGWQAAFNVGGTVTPYVRATWDREFEDMPEEAFAQAQSMPTTQAYAVPGLAFDQDYGTLLLGARAKLFGLDANVGTSLTVGQEGGNNASVFATLGGGF